MNTRLVCSHGWRIGVALCLAINSVANADPGVSVPEWFKGNADDPYAVFDAWRNLTTRDAVVTLGSGWHVTAGILVDEQGRPMGDALLTVAYRTEFRGVGAHLKTDENGYFIVYSSFVGGPKLDPDRLRVDAAPGYPVSQLGVRFASESGALKPCDVQVEQVAEDRWFCVVTWANESQFDEAEFEAFQQKEIAEWQERRHRPFRIRPREREGPADRGVRTEYAVRVETAEGQPIADAVVHYMAYDGFEGHGQAVVTDAKGECTVVEELRADRGEEYYAKVWRSMAVDIPGYAVGPISPELRTDRVNVIVAEPAASVSGTVVDWHGNPVSTAIRVQYLVRTMGLAGFGGASGPDGRFTIDRIMPGKAFRLWIYRGSHQTTPSPEVWSDPMTLEPGDSADGVRLVVPQPAAIRGIVVDEQGEPVRNIWKLTFENEHGGWGEGEPLDARFGTDRVAPIPTRIRVNAEGFDPFLSEDMNLEPGELRFVRVVMKRER